MANKVDDNCPRCKGKLILRINKQNGDKFLGCSCYPKCKFCCDETNKAIRKERYYEEKHRKQYYDKALRALGGSDRDKYWI